MMFKPLEKLTVKQRISLYNWIVATVETILFCLSLAIMVFGIWLIA